MPKIRAKIKGQTFTIEVPQGATEEQIIEAISAKHGAQVFGDKMIQKDLSEQKRAYQEQATTYQAYERQDGILSEVEFKKRRGLEDEIRSIRKQERTLSDAMESARKSQDPGAKSSWEKAAAATDPLFKKRTDLFDKLRKQDPKRAEELFDELYLKQQ